MPEFFDKIKAGEFTLNFLETGIGGVETVLNAEGGGTRPPKVAPQRLGLLTPKLAISYRISVERG